MTTLYFIRHAQSDYNIHNDLMRPLTEKGLNDCVLVTEFLQDKNIDIILSSPYKRAIDTIADFAKQTKLPIQPIEDLRERKICDTWIEDFNSFTVKQWNDFSYKLPGGESLTEVQSRNIIALNKILTQYKDKNIVIGTHGTALSTIINYYDHTFDIKDFMVIIDIMPWIVKMSFNENGCMGMEKINIFNHNQNLSYKQPTILTTGLGELKAYRFVVIFSRYENKWLYCRAKERETFETAGGHIEKGESPLESAKRELYEETGAVSFDITPAFDYSVHNPTGYSNGQVFFAKIHQLGALPDYEMSEIKLFDTIPDKMRFPQILPILYEKMQAWLNLQSAKDEIWDVYDSMRNLTGRTHRRADPLPKGDYHLVVHVWLQNNNDEFLITKRAPTKGYPNMWECTGGSAISGDDSLAAAIREAKEETGLDVKPENGRCIFNIAAEDSFCDVWLFRQDIILKNVVLQENETIDAKFANKDEILKMINNGEFIPFHYIDDLFINILSASV